LDDLFESLKQNLNDHTCTVKAIQSTPTSKKTSGATRHSSTSNGSPNDVVMLDDETVDDKENSEMTVSTTSRLTRSTLKRLSSPSLEQMSLDDSGKKASDTPGGATRSCLAKRRKVRVVTPRLEQKLRPARQRLHLPLCECLQSRVIGFQVGVFKAMADYSKTRERMMNLVKGLVQTRLKVKESTQILTNTDNLHLQPTQTGSLICPELCSESNGEEEKKRELFCNDLTSCLVSLRKLQKSLGLLDKEELDQFLHDKPLKKQFYDCIDLLGQLFGFFGLIVMRVDTLRLKLDILNFEKAKLPFSPNPTNKAIVPIDTANYSLTIVYLAKAYLNANMCDAFEQLNEEILGEKMRGSSGADDRKMASMEKMLHKIEVNRFIAAKPDTLVAYQLVFMHYLILKRRFVEAIYIMREKIFTSSITTGKQTAYYYETRYYLKYLQFMMLMANVEKHEAELNKLVEDEIPLSLLDESYVAVFSVARYYVINAIEPHRTFSSSIIQSNKIAAAAAAAATAVTSTATTIANTVLPVAGSFNSLAKITTPCKSHGGGVAANAAVSSNIAESASLVVAESVASSSSSSLANVPNDECVLFGKTKG
jgi:hypothetical protein